MRNLLYAWVLLIGLFSPALAPAFSAGDTVRLVERDSHIPAHPAAGDSRVPFRFASGSTAQILALDQPTGWLHIQGEKVGGEPAQGWITRRYIAERIDQDGPTDGDGQPPPPLAWCPPKGSPDPHPSGRLRIATWNLENLHAVNGQSTFTGSNPSVRRLAIDYERIKCYVRLFDADILAVQEVDGEAALKRVVDTDVYDVVVSKRPKPAMMNGKQNTGFAYKKGLNVQPQPDFTALDVSNGGLRHGTRIDLTHNGQTFLLMSVHLKSGCFDNAMSGSACNKLFTQVPVLEGWIDAAAGGPHPFIVLGDFNRRFNQPEDVIWTDLDDAEAPNADLTAITEHMPISCRDNTLGVTSI